MILSVASLMEGAGEAALITNVRGVIEYVNPAFEAMTGYSRTDAVGRTPAILKSGRLSREFYRDLWGTLLAGQEYRGVLINRRRDGAIYHEEKTIRPLFDDDGQISHFLSCGHDVTERLAAIERLKHHALHDGLTVLPNRTLFLDRLRQALSNARRTGEPFVVAIADLDGFKSINDTLGHPAGDAVLRAAALRLRLCVREVDTVARLGGDEFGILLRRAPDAAAAGLVLRKMVDAFAAPIGIEDGSAITLSISAGGCLCPRDGADANALMRAADRAMYRAKHDGGNAWCMADCRGDPPAAPPARRPHAAPAEGEPLLQLLQRNVSVRRRLVHAGETLFRTGDPFRDVFLIRCGACKLINIAADGRGQLVSLLFKGDWLGFDGISDGQYRCDAVTLDTGEVWAMRYEDLLHAGARSPALLGQLHVAMSREITRGRDADLAHSTLSADAKVADFLHRLADSLAGSGLSTDTIRLCVSRAEIGSHLGLAHESVSRAISRLVREQVISFGPAGRRELHIPRLAALRDFVQRDAV